VAGNIFVFGSSTAQRAGQQVNGPAAALAARFVTGPVKMNAAASPWTISSVEGDRVVIAYTPGNAPTFAAGQLICNLAPASRSEIFYRRILSVADDPATSQITLMTEDALLTDFVTQGSVSLSSESIILEMSPTGSLQKAYSLDGEITFPRAGYDLSGANFELSVDGYKTTVPGQAAQQQGSLSAFLNATAPEWYWWMTPRLRVALELNAGGIKSFEAIASGQVSTALDLEISAGISGKIERRIFDLPEAALPRTEILIGVIAVPFPPFAIPVFGELSFDFAISVSAEAQQSLNWEFAYRQEFNAAFGFAYDKTAGFDFVRSFQATAPDIDRPSISPAGSLAFKVTLEPELDFLIYSAAGMKVSLEPYGGLAVSQTTPPAYEASLEAGVDFTIGTAGPLFDFFGINAELELPIVSGQWPLTGQTLTFTAQPQSQSVAPGADVSFTCAVNSIEVPKFQWFQNGLPIPGQVSRSLFLPRVNAYYAGGYHVRATAGGQSVNSDTAALTVQTVTPENLDTDGEGLADVVETKTGTWLSATNTGTNPFKWDTDGDGLSDSVETRTFTYVSRTNTGTDPNLSDTDADGAGDKAEIDAGTDPNRGATVAQSTLRIEAGENYSLFVKTDGTLWGMGANETGQLGDGTTVDRPTPIQIATGVVQVAAGFRHSLFVKRDGTLWGMGANFTGQLGDGSQTTQLAPVQIAAGVAQVAAGGSSSFYVKSDGTLWAMGANRYGMLGDGTLSARITPVQIATGVTSVAVGGAHSLFIKRDGTLWAMGSNSAGQFGNGVSDTSPHPAPLQIATGVSQVTAAGSPGGPLGGHTLFVKSNGTLWGSGANEGGQLGDGTTQSRTTPVQIATGVSRVVTAAPWFPPLPAFGHSLFVKSNGSLWAMGTNGGGQLGDGTTESRLSPVQIATGVSQVAVGATTAPSLGHSLFIKNNGTLWSMGRNARGQLGDGTTETRLAPVQVATGL
jgi:alpha-tubulin suppressor-like RCC1 family protein